MLKIDKEKLLHEPGIRKVQFENETYFSVEDVAKHLNEDLSAVETIKLPITGDYIETATVENIEKGRKHEELSEFNKALLKMKNFPKK
jgi:hypothetical protein